MSFKIGKNLICDCCGMICFLEHHCFASEEHKYDIPPEGWMHSKDLSSDLCPVCSKRFALKMQEVVGYDKMPDEWRNLLI